MPGASFPGNFCVRLALLDTAGLVLPFPERLASFGAIRDTRDLSVMAFIHHAIPSASAPLTRIALGWVLFGGIVAGALDFAFATSFWALKGVAPQRVWQSVAAGLLGKASFEGGAITALLGVALHYLIAMTMSLVYALSARRLLTLLNHPWRYGALYGLLLYAVMTYVVVPLSAAPAGGARNPLWVACSVLAHVVLVGWPCAWFARRALRGRSQARAQQPLADGMP
jgi:hypothetical protein